MKKILCMLLACVLCVSTLGGCMTILIDPEKVVEGRVNLNAYPDGLSEVQSSRRTNRKYEAVCLYR